MSYYSKRRWNWPVIDQEQPRTTGTAAGHLMQDLNSDLFKALKKDPNARQHVRDSAELIKENREP